MAERKDSDSRKPTGDDRYYGNTEGDHGPRHEAMRREARVPDISPPARRFGLVVLAALVLGLVLWLFVPEDIEPDTAGGMDAGTPEQN